MKIALIGYGKMGKIIEEIAIQRKHQIVLKLTSKDKWDASTLINSKADVAIEFTNPESAYQNILKCFEANLPVVVGTTGWYDKLDEVINICKQKNQTMLYASNFSVGVNLFFKINEFVANLMSKYPEYNVSLIEAHHTQKKDAPSGTAISIAQPILKIYQKEKWSLHPEDKTLHISARRCGDEKGFHAVHYLSDIDEISISHHAYSRKGFAMGSVLAAEFIKDKKGIFQMKDVLNL
jgi:4-hydroxy-tetrahydrodipicolinate reductase